MSETSYLITTNNIYSDLNDYIEDFKKEAELINELKCQLINFGDLKDVCLSDGYAYISRNGTFYQIEYAGITFLIETEDNMITSYRFA